MCFANETLQIIGSAVVRIDRIVVTDSVRTADRSLLLFLADGMDRHQPENRDAEIFELIESRSDRIEVSLRRKRTRINLINHAVTHPIPHWPRRLLRKHNG